MDLKKVVIAVILFSSANLGYAQNQNDNTSQTTKMSVKNTIEISFTGNSSATGASVNIPFGTASDFANGVESTTQELKVATNKGFKVGVKTNAVNFSYSGNTTPAPTMPVQDILLLKVTANSTGGSVRTPFSTNNYTTLKSSSQDLITGGNKGISQLFSVKYKAAPGFAYPAGTYSVDVVYTATQQ